MVLNRSVDWYFYFFFLFKCSQCWLTCLSQRSDVTDAVYHSCLTFAHLGICCHEVNLTYFPPAVNNSGRASLVTLKKFISHG